MSERVVRDWCEQCHGSGALTAPDYTRLTCDVCGGVGWLKVDIGDILAALRGAVGLVTDCEVLAERARSTSQLLTLARSNRRPTIAGRCAACGEIDPTKKLGRCGVPGSTHDWRPA